MAQSTILIVDDEAALRENLEETVRNLFEMHVIFAGKVRQAKPLINSD